MELDCCDSKSDETRAEEPAAVVESESREFASESPESVSANKSEKVRFLYVTCGRLLFLECGGSQYPDH